MQGASIDIARMSGVRLVAAGKTEPLVSVGVGATCEVRQVRSRRALFSDGVWGQVHSRRVLLSERLRIRQCHP